MKNIKKYWFMIVNIVLITSLSMYVLCVGIKKARDYEIYKKPSLTTKIYTVWHVETFEGGGKSRLSYLNKIIKTIEKNNPGVLFAIQQINDSKLESLLQEQTPDIISFGYGLGRLLLPKLEALDNTFSVRDELIESGTFNNHLYAIPYIISGYALISHNDDVANFHCGETGYTKPKFIYEYLSLTPVNAESQYEAYKSFVNNKTATLLGTARDVYRINNLNNLGRTNATISPIDTYTDLIQYIGITEVNNITKEFLENVLSDNNQNSLTEYSLFSAKYNKIYNDGIYNDMENAILKARIPNVFDE